MTKPSFAIANVLTYAARSRWQKGDLVRSATDAAKSISKTPRDQTIFQGVAKEHYYIGAKAVS